MDWHDKVREDLTRADAARGANNEGMARVCARRAAGWAAIAYLDKEGIERQKNSGFETLIQIKELKLLGADALKLLDHLSLSIEKDDPEEDSHWPEEIDLLGDARKLILDLFPDFTE